MVELSCDPWPSQLESVLFTTPLSSLHPEVSSLKEGPSGLLSPPQCWDTAWNIEALDLLPDFLPFAQSTHPLGLMGSLLPSNSTLALPSASPTPARDSVARCGSPWQLLSHLFVLALSFAGGR